MIYVDLDGSLLRTDSLFEGVAALLRTNVLLLFALPVWLLRGRAYLKSRIAATVDIEVPTLPYDTEVLTYLKEQSAAGRQLVLATAAAAETATKVAGYLGIFHRVLATTAGHNLKGAAKSAMIADDCRGSAFCYLGNDSSDLAIWRTAATGILVGAPDSVARKARTLTRIEREFARPKPNPWTLLKAVRAHQWIKNLLVFLPVLTAHRWNDGVSLGKAALAFVAFSLVASSVYLLNDLVDLPSDRRHPAKRSRPLAAGTVPISYALGLLPVLLAGGLATAFAVGTPFVLVLAAYVVVTVAYSLDLKQRVLIDVGTLGALYIVRVIGGAAAIAVVPSFWLLAFSGFLFLSLAVMKRCSEIMITAKANRQSVTGRDYQVTDLSVLQALGVGCGVVSVALFALYINTPEVASLYRRPWLLWTVCLPLLYCISRLWIKTARGEMHHDPVVYVARDRGSLVMLALSVAICLAAV